MKFGKAIAVSAAALIIGMASPALAQSGVSEQGDGSADNNTTVDDTANDFLDLLSNNDILSENGNGNNRDNEANDNGNNRDNEANDNGNNRDNEANDNEANDNGNNRDNEANDNGNNRDNEANDNGNNRDNEANDNESYGDGSASRGGEVSDNGNNRDNGDTNVVVADQTLVAVITNLGMDEIIDIDSDQNGHTTSTGDAYVRGNAFAAFAGVNSLAFNTGLNANVQSATNIAARGTVNFGSAPE